MKLIMTLLIATALIGCKPEQKSMNTSISSEHVLTCEKVGGNLVRCENSEVLCYGGRGGYSSPNIHEGVSCHFKK